MNPDACKDVMDRSRIPYEGLQDIGRTNTALEEISIRKQLPFRQQTDKPILKYNTSLCKAVHLFNPLEVNEGVEPGIGTYTGTGLYFTGNPGTITSTATTSTATTSDASIAQRQPNNKHNYEHLQHYQSFQSRIRKTPTPPNPYVRPVSAKEIAANINGEKHKCMIEQAVAIVTGPTIGKSNTYVNPTLERNSFLRPISGISRDKTEHKQVNNVVSTNRTSARVTNTLSDTSSSSSQRSDDKKSVKNAMFQFASTTSPTRPIAGQYNNNRRNSGNINDASSLILENPNPHRSEKVVGFNYSSILSSKPYSETVKVIRQDTMDPNPMINFMSQSHDSAGTKTSSTMQNISESRKLNSPFPSREIASIGGLKKMPVTNTLTGTMYYRKTPTPEGKADTEKRKSSYVFENTNNNLYPNSSVGFNLNPKMVHALGNITDSRPTLERSNASIQLLTKLPTSGSQKQQHLEKMNSTLQNQLIPIDKRDRRKDKDVSTDDIKQQQPALSSKSKESSHISKKTKTTTITKPSNVSVMNENTSRLKSGSVVKGGRGRVEGRIQPEQRPMGDGAPSKPILQKEVNRRKAGVAVVDEVDDDEDSDDEKESYCDDDMDDADNEDDIFSGTTISGERLPGDGEASYDDMDEDDGLDDFEDNDDDLSEGGSDGFSINSTSSLGPQSSHGRPMTVQSSKSVKDASTLMGLEDKMKTLTTRTSSSATSVVVKPFFHHSLFKHVPPTINFVGEGEKTEQIPWELRKLLKWKMSPITPLIVKTALSRVGFRISKRNHDWLGCFGKHMKAMCFKPLREYQKLNHFPGSFQIGRKDRLWRNLSKLQLHYGKKEFNFFPHTYVLPCDLKQLKRAWEDGNSKQKWIIKPPASARGIGIKVISKWNQIPRRRPVIVQKYLARPFLINGSKFDMRVYVYISSYDPLRLYVYDDGLARFASCKYSSSMKSLSNKYMHLTNYSINKKNSNYQSNTDNNVCQGHKWSLKSLWKYMKRQGINTTAIWEAVKDLIVKTIISGDASINSMTKAHCRSRYVAHELFGFDILLDEQLRPWILEVNISPSLHSNSQLDINIKGGMIKDLMNIAGFRIPDERDVTTNGTSNDFSSHHPLNKYCMDKRLFTTQLAPDERAKHAYYCQKYQDEQIMQTILDTITPDDLRHLCESIDEDSRKGNFQRLFPTPQTHRYLRFFEQPRYYNLLLDQWVLRYNRMEQRGIILLQSFCEERIHLENPTSNSRHQWAPPNSLMASLKLGDSRAANGPSRHRSSSMAPVTARPTKKKQPKAQSLTSMNSSRSAENSSSSLTSPSSIGCANTPSS